MKANADSLNKVSLGGDMRSNVPAWSVSEFDIWFLVSPLYEC